MERLNHTYLAFVRLMQMSQKSVFAFVEGKGIDSFIYGPICKQVCNILNIDYRLCLPHMIEPGTGGKDSILAFHDFLYKNSALNTKFKDKVTIVVFFVDKDIDDLLRKKKSSKNIIYTKYYDIENHIYLAGDLTKGCSAASCVDQNVISHLFNDSYEWCSSVSKRWIKWVSMCIFSKKYNVHSQCNYGLPSLINIDCYEKIDKIKYRNVLNELQIKSEFDSTKFRKKFRNIEKNVLKKYKNGKQDEIFKGKWYSKFMSHEMKIILDTKDYNSSGLDNRLTGCIASTLDFSGQWSDYFKEKLTELINNHI